MLLYNLIYIAMVYDYNNDKTSLNKIFILFKVKAKKFERRAKSAPVI